MGKTVTLSQAATILGRLNMERAAVLGLQSAAQRGVTIITTEIIPALTPEPLDRGVYKAGWRHSPLEDGAIIENNEPHAIFIEKGVRADHVKVGRLMLEALAEWALRKGLAKDKIEAKSVAWAIAMRMKQRGIFGPKGMGVLKTFIKERAPKVIRAEIAREVRRAVKAQIG